MIYSPGTAPRVASPQTSFGVRLSRIRMRDKRTPKDVCGEATPRATYEKLFLFRFSMAMQQKIAFSS